MAGITKWFWVTLEGYLSYLLPKFEDLVHTSLGSGAISTRQKCVTVTADYCKIIRARPEIEEKVERGVADGLHLRRGHAAVALQGGNSIGLKCCLKCAIGNEKKLSSSQAQLGQATCLAVA